MNISDGPIGGFARARGTGLFVASLFIGMRLKRPIEREEGAMRENARNG